MFSTGDTNPERITIGIINTKQKTIACCIVFDSEEMDKPTPTELAVKQINPINKVKKLPLNGIPNQVKASTQTKRA